MQGRIPLVSRVQRKVHLGVLSLALLVGLNGCATIGAMSDDQKIFGGIRFIGERAGEPVRFGPCGNCGPCWLWDLPLSLAADAICLPVTVTLAIFRGSTSKPAPDVKSTEQGDR